MSKNLTLTLNATDIKQAVKADSYITGQIDKSADMVKNAALAYNEQAGDEEYHETKLLRTMKGALAKLEAAIAEYVETSDASASVTDSLTSAEGTFTITITVGDRTSAAFAKPLAYLAQEYIINTMLYSWWQPIKPALAKDYVAFAADNILDMKRCLSKSAPTTTTTYSDVSGSVTPSTPTKQNAVVSFLQEELAIEPNAEPVSVAATTTPAGLTLTYSSSDESVATVDNEGIVTPVSEGTATITASFAGNSQYNPASATMSLTVQENPGPPQLDPSDF